VAIFCLLVLAMVAGAAGASRRRPVLLVRADEHADALALHRHVARWRRGGLAVAVAVTVVLVALGPSAGGIWGSGGDAGRTLALLPATVGLSLLLGTALGELTAPRLRSRLRTATVESRRFAELVPRRLAAVVGVGLVTLCTLLAVASAMGSADDLGRNGRSLTVACSAATGVAGAGERLVSSSVGPWPGTFYAVPIAAGLAVLGAVAAVTLGAVFRRPRPSAASAGLDTVLRRHASRNVFLTLGLLVFGTLSPVAALMATGIARDQCRPAWWAVPGWGLAAVALVAVALTVWSLLSLLVSPVLRVRESRPAPFAAGRGTGAGS
jgi:hypothetical protein